jgi:hypothetical protein
LAQPWKRPDDDSSTSIDAARQIAVVYPDSTGTVTGPDAKRD